MFDLSADLIWLVLALAASGLLAGLVAGLFGVGGGVVIVPALYHAFGALGVADEARMHAAVATSLATIVVTSVRSAQAHAKAGAVDWTVVRTWGPWIVAGALAGGLLARFVSGAGLTFAFGIGALIVALRMAFFAEARPIATHLPTGAGRAVLAGGLGLASSWLGVGGGVFGVMAMTLCGRPIHQAVATASAFGAAIGLPGALGFVASGWGVAGLPPASLGYVNLPGFALIAALTAIMAPVGAKLAHRLSTRRLTRAFAVCLALVAAQMLWEAGAGLIGAG